jgi:hypothetical protein
VQVRQRAVLVRALSSLQRGVVVAQQHRGLQQWRAVGAQAVAAVAAAKALAVRHSTAGKSTLQSTILHCTLHKHTPLHNIISLLLVYVSAF